MAGQGRQEHDTVRRSAGLLVGVLGDRVVACDVVENRAHVVGGLLAWLLLLDEATPLADLVADVVASTGSTEEAARDEVTEAVRLGESLQLLGRECTSPPTAPAPPERTVVLRAGAVRSPAGDIWLLPGGDDVGVPTLISALVEAGCDDLGREVVGVRRDSIVVAGPEPLQGEYGPIARILLCEHRPDREAAAAPLDPYGVAEGLIGSAINLPRVGGAALQMVCDLAATAPGLRIVHHDPLALARVLVAAGDSGSLEDLDEMLRRHRRQHHELTQPVMRYLGDLDARISADVVFLGTTIEGEDVTLVVDRSGYRSWALAGLHRRIWHAVAAHEPPDLSELARGEADRRGGSDERSARVVARALASLVREGLVDQVPGRTEPETVESSGGDDQGEEVREMWRYGPSGPRMSPASVAEPWASLASSGYAVDWFGHRLVTDVDSIRPVLTGLPGAVADGGPARPRPGAVLVEIRSIPGPAGEMLIRLNGTRLWWVSENDGLSVLGIILANLAADRHRLAQPWGEISVATRRDRCVVTVGTALEPGPGDEAAVRHHGTLFGARVDDRRVLIPEATRAARWLTRGAPADELARLWTPYALAGVVALGAPDVLSGWLRTLTELTPYEGASERYLSETVAQGDISLSVVNEGETQTGAVERILAEAGDPGRTENTPGVVRSGRTTTEPRGAETDLRSAAWRWASRLGRPSWVEESAKITPGRLSVGRGLLRIRLPGDTGADLDGPASLASDPVRNAIGELGLDAEVSEEVARASLSTGNLYLGVEPEGSHIRRKLYVRGLTAPGWRPIASRWPHRLRRGDDTPYWLAWKWTDDGSRGIERAVYLAHLGGVETIGQETDPLMGAMEPEWVDVVGHLLGLLGIGRQQAADDGDLLVLDETGRRSVDLSRRAPVRGPSTFEAEARWLAAAAELNAPDSEGLVAWSRGRVLSRLIFGIDGRGEQFVNLYGSRLTDR